MYNCATHDSLFLLTVFCLSTAQLNLLKNLFYLSICFSFYHNIMLIRVETTEYLFSYNTSATHKFSCTKYVINT